MANWPDHQIDTQHLDANSDSMTLAREDLLDAAQELNRIIAARGLASGIASLGDDGTVPVSQLSGAAILSALAPVDGLGIAGLGSGLDADLLQGINGEDYALLDGSRQFSTTGSTGHDFNTTSASPAIVRVALRVGHTASGTPAVGMGTAIRYVIGAVGGLGTAAHAEAGWLDPNLGTLTSRFSILTMESLTFLEQARWNYGYQEMRQITTPAAALNTNRARFWFQSDGFYYEVEGGPVVGPLIDAGGVGADHGSLTGLLDDDHTQYARTDGTRELTGILRTGAFPILMTELGGAPSTPASAKWHLYFKSDGLYMQDDAGVETSISLAGGTIDHQTTTNRGDPLAHEQYALLQPSANQTINAALGDFDFTFNGDSVANLLHIDAGLDRLYVNCLDGDLSYDGWLNLRADPTAPPGTHGISVQVNNGGGAFGIVVEALSGTGIYAISNGFGATALAAGRFADSASSTFEVLDAMGGTLGSPLVRIRPYPASQGTFFEINTNLVDRLVQVQHDNFYVNRDNNAGFDFRVYGGTLDDLFVVNAGNDKVTINGDVTNARFNVIGGSTVAAYFLATSGQTAIDAHSDSGVGVSATVGAAGAAVIGIGGEASTSGLFARTTASLSASDSAAVFVEVTEAGDIAPGLHVKHSGTGQLIKAESSSGVLWSLETGGEMQWRERATDPAGNPTAGYLFLYPKADGNWWDKDSSGNVRQIPAGLGTAVGDIFSWDGTEWIVSSGGAGGSSGIISGANGSQMTTFIDVYTVTNPTGASQLVGGGFPVLPVGDIIAVLIRVNSSLGGCDSFDIGTEEDPTAWGEAIAPSAGTTTSVKDFHIGGEMRIQSTVQIGPSIVDGKHLYLRARGANFNATGTVRIAVIKRTYTTPTS